MIYDIINTTKTPRIIYDGMGDKQREISIAPGETVRDVELAPHIADMLMSRTNDLTLRPLPQLLQRPTEYANGYTAADPAKPPMVIVGMFGIGDNLHQRAGLREVMKTHNVWLESPHYTLYHDLIAQGLKVMVRPTKLRAQAKTLEREKHLFVTQKPPANAEQRKIWYHKPDIDTHGSILESMTAQFGVTIEKPDFSLPLMPEWVAKADKLIASWNVGGKPILIYRPMVLRREWDGSARNPDIDAYTVLFQQMRNPYFVVSVADLAPGLEWIVGPEQPADVKLHFGELDFGTMAALWARAALVFSPAGFAPVLAQAVGTPGITIYGGREGYDTTERAGAHLAPTCGIDPDNACNCHSHTHRCDKRITLWKAHAKIAEFLAGLNQTESRRITVTQSESPRVVPTLGAAKPRTLIYATTYVDSPDRERLTSHWVRVHAKLNPDCDILVVDSASPSLDMLKRGCLSGFAPYVEGKPEHLMLYSFPDNVGHLARKGKDGWGRAFGFGLQAAVACGYEYVVHIEGDSLLKLPVMPIVQEMKRDGTEAASVPVAGTKRVERGWAETGLMFFSTKFISSSKFVERYNWPTRRPFPTPEVIVFNMLGHHLKMMPWRAHRFDKEKMTVETAHTYDWVTHCHSDMPIFDRFAEEIMGDAAPQPAPAIEPPAPAPVQMVNRKLNLGCGTNKLPGWENHDADVDISKPLPYGDNTFTHILCEHCVEHIDQYAALEFFKECYRVLMPGGVVRIAVPSIEQIRKCSNPAYFKFTTKFHDQGATVRGAMHNIVYKHGHKALWSTATLEAALELSGFDAVTPCRPGQSLHNALRDIEGHHKVITKPWNDIETCVVEGTAIKPHAVTAGPVRQPLLAVKIECGETGPLPARMMFPEDRKAIIGLLRSINCETFVEIGVNEGFSARAFLDNVPTIKKYKGIDVTPDHVPSIKAQLTEVPKNPAWLVKNDPRFELIVRKRGSFDLSDAEVGQCDALLIDGDHGREAVTHDSQMAWRLVRPGGIIFWHDYKNVDDTTAVLEEMAATGAPILHADGSMVAFQKIPTSKVAVVVGGGESVWSEVDQARKLCGMVGAEITFFLVNDMLARFPFGGIGVSLHPESIKGWLDQRKALGYPALPQIWCNREHRSGLVTNNTRDWGGSGGLFAAGPVAIKGHRFSKVILCGVPMTVSEKHFVRHVPWNACQGFQRCWEPHFPEIKPHVRSFSGWTAEKLGRPDAAFLTG